MAQYIERKAAWSAPAKYRRSHLEEREKMLILVNDIEQTIGERSVLVVCQRTTTRTGGCHIGSIVEEFQGAFYLS